MRKYTPFISFWALNSLVLYLATLVFAGKVVLGTAALSLGGAAVFAGFWVTLLVWVAKPLCARLNLPYLQGRVNMFLFYWLANSVAIWLVARLAPFTGLGIARFYWAIVVGLGLNVLQWFLWQGLKAYKLAPQG